MISPGPGPANDGRHHDDHHDRRLGVAGTLALEITGPLAGCQLPPSPLFSHGAPDHSLISRVSHESSPPKLSPSHRQVIATDSDRRVKLPGCSCNNSSRENELEAQVGAREGASL
jgi:hypothetical protein